MRIGVAGCSGTGKSILAERLSKSLGFPFLPAKDITTDILNRDGYDYASGQPVEKFLATDEHQAEIFKRTREQQDVQDFVTDRTFVDLAAYAVLEMDNRNKVEKYVEDCRKMVGRYTHVVFCPWENREILNNQKRTLDPWYQFAVHSVQIGIMESFGVVPVRIGFGGVEERVEELLKIIKL